MKETLEIISLWCFLALFIVAMYKALPWKVQRFLKYKRVGAFERRLENLEQDNEEQTMTNYQVEKAIKKLSKKIKK